MVTLSGVCFYPLLKNYVLGQVQTFISLFFATALYFWLKNRQTASGAVLGLMCLIKPQYGLFLIWLALRRKFRALAAGGIVLTIGCAIVAVVFGWREQLRYLDVLTFMGRHGESYWPNESINGLMNRLLFNGPNLQWQPHAFAPYNGLIYAVTVFTSAGLIISALVLPMLRSRTGSPVDFSIMAITLTVASPITWEHHYGILLPIFALLVAEASRERRLGWLAAAYVLCSNSWSPFNALAGTPVLNALQSIRLFGVFLLIGFLYKNCGERRVVLRNREPGHLLTSFPAT